MDITAIATATPTRACAIGVSALLKGLGMSERGQQVGDTAVIAGVRTPAFPQDSYEGIHAWSPPV